MDYQYFSWQNWGLRLGSTDQKRFEPRILQIFHHQKSYGEVASIHLSVRCPNV